MKAMRILSALALVFVASTAMAQGGGQGMDRAAMQARQNEMLFKDITLTDAQKAKVDTIQTKAAAERTAMMQGGQMDETARAKMAEMRTKTNTAIRAVLTAEQQPIFDKNLAAMPVGGGRRPPTSR